MADEAQKQALRQAVSEAWERHNLGTYSQAERRLDIERTSLLRLRKYGIGSKTILIEWAVGLREDINYWFEIAGYDPIPPELLHPKPGDIIVFLKEGVTELSAEDRQQIIALGEELKRKEDEKTKRQG